MRPMSVVVGGIALFFALACSGSTEETKPVEAPKAAEPEPAPPEPEAVPDEGKAGKAGKADGEGEGKAGKGKKGG